MYVIQYNTSNGIQKHHLINSIYGNSTDWQCAGVQWYGWYQVLSDWTEWYRHQN